MYPAPVLSTSNTMYDIVKKLPYEKLQSLFKSRNMAYTENERKKCVALQDKVYRELSNTDKIKDILYNLSKRSDVIETLDHLYTNNGEIAVEENKLFLKEHSSAVEALENAGLLFRVKGQLIILPNEYFFILASGEVLSRYATSESTLIKGLWIYLSDEIKLVLAHINKTYRQSYDTTLPKIYCASAAYKYIVSNSQKLHDNHTKTQNEILDFILNNNNRVSPEQLLRKYPLNANKKNDHYWSYSCLSGSDIVDRYRRDGEEKSDIRKLFFTGFLILSTGAGGERWIAIPKELYSIASKEYLAAITQKRKNIETIIYTCEPLAFKKKQGRVHEDMRKFLAAVSSPESRLNKNDTLSNKTIRLIAELTGFSENEVGLFFNICGKNRLITKKWSEYLQCNTPSISSKAIETFTENPETAVLKMCIETITPEYRYSKHSDLPGHENNLLKIVLSALSELTKKEKSNSSWISTNHLRAYMELDSNFAETKMQWEQKQSTASFDSFEEEIQDNKAADIDNVLSQIYRQLFHIGILDIINPDNSAAITHIRLSGIGRTYLSTAIASENSAGKCPSTPPEKKSAAEKEASIIIQPNNEILVCLDSSLEIIANISRFASPKSIDKYCTYQISKESVMRAASEGFDPEMMCEYIEKYTGRLLPSTTKALISGTSSRCGEIEMKTCAGCLIFNDPILAKEIQSNRSVKNILKDSSQPKESQSIILIEDKAIMDTIYKHLRKCGYGIKKSN